MWEAVEAQNWALPELLTCSFLSPHSVPQFLSFPEFQYACLQESRLAGLLSLLAHIPPYPERVLEGCSYSRLRARAQAALHPPLLLNPPALPAQVPLARSAFKVSVHLGGTQG